MSLLRVSRLPVGSKRNPPKARRKKPSAKHEWDSTVHDLTVHRATPEDLIRRHEMHKSKNKVLVHVELQEKALKSKWKKQRPRAPESLEKKKLTLMREILSDQYQLQDVLERSDQAMAMVKDLFGDVPRRHLGFPNVTVAPDYDVKSSQGLITQKDNPPTQLSILSESIMDPQALNEIEGEHSFTCKTNSENDVYLNFRSNIDPDRVLLKEDNSGAICLQEASKQQVSTTSSQEVNMLSTPTTHYQSLGYTVLNATNVVKKVHSKLQNEEQASDATYIVQQVLNANVRKQKQTSTKVKKKQSAQSPDTQKRSNLSTAATCFDLPNGNKSSLEVLNQMVHDMENEMEEYERWMGHEVQQAHNGQGLSGFTCSLVNALCRLLRYLKEIEARLRQEKLNRQQLERELSEHRTLVDALTAEVLLVREENLVMQNKLQQYMIVTDEQLISLMHAFGGLPITGPNIMTNPGDLGELSVRSPEVAQEKMLSDDVGSKRDTLELSQGNLPNKKPVLLNPLDKMHPCPTLTTCIIQPAVLLSPPQQMSSQALPLLQDDSTERESEGEQRFSLSKPLIVQEDGSSVPQRSDIPVATKISQNSLRSDGQSLVSTRTAMPRQGFDGLAERSNADVTMMFTQNDDLQGQIAELTLQNSVIKAQLNKFSHCHQETWNILQQPVSVQNGSVVEGQGHGEVISSMKELPKSLDERIAELNRQSAEARGKLLLLTSQQKVPTFISVSPPVSPIPSPAINLLVAETLDSSKEDIPSPASGTSAKRSIEMSSQMCLSLNTSLGKVHLTCDTHRLKTEKQREEGWFALSAHIE
ncbi:spindle and centriole-associated protein 1 isoform X2 [Rhineura floridana]|uniref:spindle and centriole-associated protein 1 isoform X2 n=1 Tax=Rhineura floridana TaxID=261503 RepID=UPI002AC88FCE|nr:spindle and centriole-associated protein 1 isoform X2 [Rhineura floridana]